VKFSLIKRVSNSFISYDICSNLMEVDRGLLFDCRIDGGVNYFHTSQISVKRY